MTIKHTTVKVNGVEFHVAHSDGGQGPDILFLHGYPEGWMAWRLVMGQLDGCRMWAPDLRGYGTSQATEGYDVWTLSDDVLGLIEALGLERPMLVGSDWGAELGWIFAHRYSGSIIHLVAINGPHPRTLARAVFRFDDFQTLRLPWIPIFEIPRFPEWFMTTAVGRRVLRWALLIREGSKGAMNRELVDEIVARYQHPQDMRGPVNWYRSIVATYLSRRGRKRLKALYEPPITVPVTLVWGEKDGALSTKVARNSFRDAKCDVEWRPLPGVGHFVALEAPERLAKEIARVLSADRRAEATRFGL